MKKSLIGYSRNQISDLLLSYGIKEKDLKMRITQIFHGINYRGFQKIDEITSISKNLRGLLGENFTLERTEIKKELISKDGTIKWLLSLEDKNEIETVYIPEKNRGSLCISSQVGCTLKCSFCHTGTMPLVRNLTASEIVAQVFLAKDKLNDWQKNSENRRLSNIILMGMGEPLYNYEEVCKAIKILVDPEGINFSKRKVTLSTAGIIPMIERLGEDLGIGLAVSLHAVRDDIRNKLVPINKKYPIKDLLSALKKYAKSNQSRKITFEYVMLKDINDSLSDARELCRIISGIPAKINLIPFNPWPNNQYQCSDQKKIRAFSEVISNAGYSSPIRKPRGRDIMAACGQLISESRRNNRPLQGSINI